MPLLQQIDSLKNENSKLKADVDALEQKSRRELVRFSGITETVREDNTDIINKILRSIDPSLKDGDIIRSHRVSKTIRLPLGTIRPRQIIVRLRDPITKQLILKASKDLKDGELYSHVAINEDLTKNAIR